MPWLGCRESRRFARRERSHSGSLGNRRADDAGRPLAPVDVRGAGRGQSHPEMIVVLADDGLTPVDVVSDANYAGCAELAGDPYALIASYAIDRMTGKPRLHRQRFLTAANGHVINAAQRWDDERRVEAHNPDKAMLEMHRWLTRRVLEGELRNPRLTELKQAITDAKANLDKAGNVPEDVRTRLIRELDLAITALMEETTKTVDGRP